MTPDTENGAEHADRPTGSGQEKVRLKSLGSTGSLAGSLELSLSL
jgi:hypothetical protein